MIKSPVSLLLAAVLAVFALSSGAQQPAAPAAAGASGLTVAPPQAASSAPAPGPSAATPAPAAPNAVAGTATAKADPAAGEARFGAACVACHGQGGNSGTPANPKLAAQHDAYIVKQLQEFKSGKRPNPIMQGFASQLTDADMKNIAAYVSTQKSAPGFAKDDNTLKEGAKDVGRAVGTAAREVGEGAKKVGKAVGEAAKEGAEAVKELGELPRV